MSGIYINGMEMPKSCEDCPCAYFTEGAHHDFCQALGYDSEIKYGSERKLDNCPLAPAADVVPVRHGRWIWDDEGYHCSECFYHAYGETGEVLSGNWRYCPNCGANMKDGDNDGI